MALARSFIVKPWPSEIITNIARLYVSHLPFATDRNGSLYLEPYPVDRKQLANQLAFKSHALYSACLPVLWEYIVISSSEALQRTALLLETGTSQETRVMGAYVRRVDFCIDQEYDPEEIQRILRKCPNVEVVFLQNRGRATGRLFKDDDTVRGIARACPKIHRLHLATFSDPPTLQNIAVLGKDWHRLETLQVLVARGGEEAWPLETSHIPFARLSTLWLGGRTLGTWGEPPGGADLCQFFTHHSMLLPNLRRVDSRLLSTSWRGFLMRYGAQLSVLSMGTADPGLMRPTSALTLCPHLDVFRLHYDGSITRYLDSTWLYCHDTLKNLVILPPTGPDSFMEWIPAYQVKARDDLIRLLRPLVLRQDLPKANVTLHAAGVFHPAGHPDWWWEWELAFRYMERNLDIVGGDDWVEKGHGKLDRHTPAHAVLSSNDTPFDRMDEHFAPHHGPP